MKNRILIIALMCFSIMGSQYGISQAQSTHEFDGLFENNTEIDIFSPSEFDSFESFNKDEIALYDNIYDEEKGYYVCSVCGSRIWGGEDTPCAVCEQATGMPVGNVPIVMFLCVFSYIIIITIRRIETKLHSHSKIREKIE